MTGPPRGGDDVKGVSGPVKSDRLTREFFNRVKQPLGLG